MNTRSRCISSSSKLFRWNNINIAGKRLPYNNNCNEAEKEVTGLEAEGKVHGAKIRVFLI